MSCTEVNVLRRVAGCRFGRFGAMHRSAAYQFFCSVLCIGVRSRFRRDVRTFGRVLALTLAGGLLSGGSERAGEWAWEGGRFDWNNPCDR